VFDCLQIISTKIDRIEIFSSIGLKVIDSDFKEKIDVSILQSGLYFIRIGNKINKFIKI
jgi:hypothetical protein